MFYMPNIIVVGRGVWSSPLYFIPSPFWHLPLLEIFLIQSKLAMTLTLKGCLPTRDKVSKPPFLVIRKDERHTWPKLFIGFSLDISYSPNLVKNEVSEKSRKVCLNFLAQYSINYIWYIFVFKGFNGYFNPLTLCVNLEVTDA